jgi:hypothetical protein
MPAGTTLPKSPVGATPTYDPLWTARFLQLTSSALKNFASNTFTKAPANLTTMTPETVFTEQGGWEFVKFKDGEFTVYESNPFDDKYVPVPTPKDELKPSGLFRQHINDAYNSRYVSEHNLGVVTFQGKTVTHYFVTPAGKEAERTWDFTNPKPWE